MLNRPRLSLVRRLRAALRLGRPALTVASLRDVALPLGLITASSETAPDAAPEWDDVVAAMAACAESIAAAEGERIDAACREAIASDVGVLVVRDHAGRLLHVGPSGLVPAGELVEGRMTLPATLATMYPAGLS